MNSAPTVVAVGELLAEFVAVGADGRPMAADMDAPRLYAGPFASGAPAIAVDQAALCGAIAIMVGAVGADLFGEVILSRLQADGVDVSAIHVDEARPTGTAHVAYRSDGGRSFVFHIDGTAADTVTVPALPHDAVLMVSGSSLGRPALRRATLEAVQQVSARGGEVALDPNVRPELLRDEGAREALFSVLDVATVVTPSLEDIAALVPGEAPHAAAEALLRRGPRIVALTKGEGGVALLSGNERWELSAHHVDAVDPTGAGDAFFATLLTLLAEGRPLEEAARFANAAGALGTTRLGPMEGNARLSTIAAFLDGQPLGEYR